MPKLDFNIYLGFAAYGFPEKEGNDLIKTAGEALGKNITDDKETLFKRAVASLLLKTKVEIAAKPQESLTRNEAKMAQQLKDLPLEGGPGCIDNILNSEVFTAYAEKIIPRYKPEEDKSWESLSTGKCLANIGLATSLGQFTKSGLVEEFGRTSANLNKEASQGPAQKIKNK